MIYLKNTPKGWQPPFCPNANCKFHHHIQVSWRYKNYGTYTRKSDNRRIQRFKCLSCGRTFSTQTFSTTYWQKRPDVDAMVFSRVVNGMCNRQVARDIGIDHTTVDRKISRLGRHCLLFLSKMAATGPPANQIVYDGFETFELSQYYPVYHNIAVEKGTDFILFFNDSELRRKGRMTAGQKKRRAELEAMHGRPDPRAIETATAELLSVVIEDQEQVTVYTDDHHQYRNPIRSYGDQIRHEVTPGKARRDRGNSLWESNLTDLFIRHSGRNHARETIAWSKRRQSSAEHLAVFAVWRNYILGRRQKQRQAPTPAMERGMLDRRLSIEDVLQCRLFPGQVKMPESWERYYGRDVVTRALPTERRHRLRYAQ